VAGDVLGRIVHAEDENGELLSEAQILGHLNILLVAGHETTTTLGGWTLYQLAQRPEWVARLRREVDEALAEHAAIGDTDAPFPIETLRRMPELDNFIKETGRLYPPVFNVPRGVVGAFEFGGYEIPAGVHIRLSLAASHLLGDVFADPETFDPDRFAGERREDRATPYSLVTFGGGPRICIGINFANIEVRLLAAYVLRHFDLEAVPDQPARHVGYFTSMAPDGLHLVFKPRTK
jgi:cytochrome P450